MHSQVTRRFPASGLFACLTSRNRQETAAVGVPAVAVIVPVLLGLLVRLVFVLASDFPLHDGGLFYLMVQELQAAHLVPPLYTAYNGAHIPFAYPPLAFYLVAILNWITGIDLIQIFRFWPVAVNTLTIFAFYRLARDVLEDGFAAWAATLAFALLPGTYLWRMMGGGLTRSLGLLFCVCALAGACATYRTPSRRNALVYGLFAGLTVLSHPEAGYFMASSSLILMAVLGRSRRSLAHFLLAAAFALVIAGPWAIATVLRYGPGIFLLAAQRAPAYFGVTTVLLAPTGEAHITVWLFLGCLGAIICLGTGRRRYLLVWIAVVGLLHPRSSDQLLEVPIALLAGIGLLWASAMINLKGRGAIEPGGGRSDATAWHVKAGVWQSPRAALLLGLVIGYSVFSTFTSRDAQGLLQGISPEVRSAMQWTAENTPAPGKFLVLAAGPWWFTDRTSEWFPALAHRTSVDTDQGYEWLGLYPDRNANKVLAEYCLGQDADCLAAWSRETGLDFDYVFLATPAAKDASTAPDASPLRKSLRADIRYELVYDGPGASIFHRQ